MKKGEMGSPLLLAGKYGCGPNRAGPGGKLMKLDIAPSAVMYATGLACKVVDISSMLQSVVLTYGFKLRQSLFTARTYKVASHLEEFNLTLEFTRGFLVGALHSSSCLKAFRRLQTLQTVGASVALQT